MKWQRIYIFLNIVTKMYILGGEMWIKDLLFILFYHLKILNRLPLNSLGV